MVTYIFNGTMEGLLTAVFEFYEHRHGAAELIWDKYYLPSLIGETVTIISNKEKAQRVWAGLEKKLSKEWLPVFYKASLAEDPEVYKQMFCFARYIFDNPAGAEKNFGNQWVMALSKADRMVNREKHRMKAFIRFQKTADGMYYAPVEPDFNVLPLIAGFFKNRYADQQWIIYDIKRKYGLYYNLHKVQVITCDFVSSIDTVPAKLPAGMTDAKEELASLLWKDYFDNTNIPARRNMKLHVQHVPRRYWKYLNEKEGKN